MLMSRLCGARLQNELIREGWGVKEKIPLLSIVVGMIREMDATRKDMTCAGDLALQGNDTTFTVLYDSCVEL